MNTFKPGDVFLTRWLDESKNTSPGYWNHAAILGYYGYIIESIEDEGVSKKDFDSWFNKRRKESYIVLRHVNNEIAVNASQAAHKYIGKPYRLITSTFTIIGPLRASMGLNCVALVRLAYRDASGIDPRVSFPDDFLRLKDFRKIYGN